MEELEQTPSGPEPEQEASQPEPAEAEQTPAEYLATADGSMEDAAPEAAPAVSVDELILEEPADAEGAGVSMEDAQLQAVVESIVYVSEEPVTPAQIAVALDLPVERIRECLVQLTAEFERAEHGIAIREVAGGFKMATKAEHHESVRNFVKSLKTPLKLSLPALETLAVIAYKQPVTTPEILEIRGVQGGGVIKTLLERKLITEAGRKNVIGKPILYKTTKDFLIQFGLKDLSELPSLKEFEELGRMAFGEAEPENQTEMEFTAPGEAPPESDAAPAEAGSESVASEPPAEAESSAEPPAASATSEGQEA